MNRVSTWTFRPTVTRKGKTTKTKIWWLGWSVDGRKGRKSSGTANHTVAKQLARELEAKLIRQENGLYDPTTEHRNTAVDDVIAAYHESKVDVSPKTISTSLTSINHFKRITGVKLVREIRQRYVSDFIRVRHKEVSNITVNKDLRHVRAMLYWARKNEYIQQAPDFAGCFLSEDRPKPVRVSDDDISAVIAALQNPELVTKKRPREWWLLFFRFLLFTGCRRGEALGLEWRDIDFKTGDITIRKETSKSKRDRTYPQALDMVLHLKAWREFQTSEPGEGDKVFPYPYTCPSRLYKDWAAIIKAAGVDYFVLHDCRSTCVSELLEDRALTSVRDWVGHSTTRTTEVYYANTDQDRADLARQRKVR